MKKPLKFHFANSYVLTVLFILFFANALFAGGPWPKQKGKGFFQLSGTHKTYSARYMGGYSSTIVRGFHRGVNESSLTFYGEYGLTDKITLVADLPFRIQSTSENVHAPTKNPFDKVLPAGKLNAFGNASLSLRYPLVQKKYILSAQMKVSPNMASQNIASGLRSDYDAWSFSPSLLLGRGWDKFYFFTEVGFTARTNRYAQGITGGFEIGRSLTKNGYLMLVSNMLFVAKQGNYPSGNSEQTATFVDNQGFTSLGLKFYKKIGDNFSFNLAVLSGFAIINQGNQPVGLYMGVAYEL